MKWNLIERIFAMVLWLNKRPDNEYRMLSAFGFYLYMFSTATLFLINFLLLKINRQLYPSDNYGFLIGCTFAVLITIIFSIRKKTIRDKYINHEFKKDTVLFISCLIGTPIYFLLVLIFIKSYQ
jgi:hypothetical protein